MPGIFYSSAYLLKLLYEKNIDICGLSEHWLQPHNIHFLDYLSSDYCVNASCDSDLQLDGIYSKRRIGKGGVAIMWYEKHANSVTPLCIDDNRIIGVQYQVSASQFLYLVQVYMPSANHNNAVYSSYIDKLFDLWNTYSENGICVFLGDFNAKFINRSTVARDKCSVIVIMYVTCFL